MITVERLSKSFSPVTAVSELSFQAPSGVVSGFVRANGAGESTTIRAILLDRPAAGRALIGGLPYGAHRARARIVGAVIDPQAAQRGRTARDHLRWVGADTGVGNARRGFALLPRLWGKPVLWCIAGLAASSR